MKKSIACILVTVLLLGAFAAALATEMTEVTATITSIQYCYVLSARAMAFVVQPSAIVLSDEAGTEYTLDLGTLYPDGGLTYTTAADGEITYIDTVTVTGETEADTVVFAKGTAFTLQVAADGSVVQAQAVPAENGETAGVEAQ